MSTCLLIPPSEDLVEAVRSQLRPEGVDHSSNLVIFPGKRPAFYLRKYLARSLGGAFIPPRIVSMEEFVGMLVPDDAGRRTLGPLDAASVLFGIHRSSSQKFGGEVFDTLEGFLPLGMKLFAELEELKIARASVARVRETVGGISYGKVHLIPGLYETFYAEAEGRGFVTRAMRYATAASSIDSADLSEFTTIVVAGFFALTPSDEAIVRNLQSRDGSVLIFQRGTGIRRVLERLGLDPEDPEPSSPGSVAYYSSPDTHGQVFSLTSIVQNLTAAGEALDERSVIVLPNSGTLFPVMRETLTLLPEHGYNISLGYPLERTPVFGWYRQLLATVEGVHAGLVDGVAYIRWLLHPYTKSIVLDASKPEATRTLAHAVEDHLAGQPGRRWMALEDLEGMKIPERILAGSWNADELRTHLRTLHDTLLRPLLRTTSVADFAEKSIAAVNFIHDHSSAKSHPFFPAFARRLTEVLDGLSRSLAGKERFAEFASYVRLLLHAVGEADVHFPGTPLRGLQTLGFLETRNIRFKRVMLLDVNEDVLPGSGGAPKFLPDRVRQTLGLETSGDRDRLAEFSFSILLNGAEEVHLFFVEDGKREKSRFVERMLWELQRRDGRAEAAPYVHKVRYRLSLRNGLPPDISKTREMVEFLRAFSFSASALDTYLECGLKFYYASVLGLRDKEEVSDEVDAADVGTLVHDVLKDFFEPLRNAALDASNLDAARLSAIVERRFASRMGGNDFGNLRLIKGQVEKQLRRFLQQYQIPAAERSRIVLEDVETDLSAPMWGYQFRVRVDRVERRDEQFAILDYKTGADVAGRLVRWDTLNPDDRRTWQEGLGSVQLPLYALLFSSMRGIPPDHVNPAFLLLGKPDIDPSIERSLFEDGRGTSEQYGVLKGVLEGILQEIVDPNTPFHRAHDPKTSCPRCPFNTVCGTAWIENPWG